MALAGLGLIIGGLAAGVIFTVEYSQYLIKNRIRIPKYLRELGITFPNNNE
jgi:hypothetical protein